MQITRRRQTSTPRPAVLRIFRRGRLVTLRPLASTFSPSTRALIARLTREAARHAH